jgi:TolB protein
MTFIRTLTISAFALLCAAANLGTFEADSGIAEDVKPGSADFNPATGEYRISGAGGDIWGKSDGFHYVWKKVSGDVTLSADVQFIGAGAMAHRKAALMIRQSLDPDSAYADAVVHGDGLTSLQFRPAAGEMSQDLRVVAKSDLSEPLHLRIERHGNTFTASTGSAGGSSTSGAPSTVVMTGNVYIGLAVSSHKADTLETAVFRNVAVTQAK